MTSYRNHLAGWGRAVRYRRQRTSRRRHHDRARPCQPRRTRDRLGTGLPRHWASAHPVHCRQILTGDPGSLVERGGTFRPHPDVRSHRGRRTHRRDLGQDGLHPRRPSARRSRTLDLRTEPVQCHRPVACRRCDRSQCGNRADRPGPDRPAAARHRRKGNPLRHRSPVLRLRPRAGTPDEARNRNRLQPGQRIRRR